MWKDDLAGLPLTTQGANLRDSLRSERGRFPEGPEGPHWCCPVVEHNHTTAGTPMPLADRNRSLRDAVAMVMHLEGYASAWPAWCFGPRSAIGPMGTTMVRTEDKIEVL